MSDASIREFGACPFCNSVPHIDDQGQDGVCSVSCSDCGLAVVQAPTREDALALWNRRDGQTSSPIPARGELPTHGRNEVINNWSGGATLQTWPDGELQFLFARDTAGNAVKLGLQHWEAQSLAFAVSPYPQQLFDRARAADKAIYDLSYPEARADELRQIADEIDCGGGCDGCGPHKLDRGEFCGFVTANSLRDLARALELKSAVDKQPPSPPAAASAFGDNDLFLEMAAALRPFAKAAEVFDGWSTKPPANNAFTSFHPPGSNPFDKNDPLAAPITYGDCRRARAILGEVTQ